MSGKIFPLNEALDDDGASVIERIDPQDPSFEDDIQAMARINDETSSQDTQPLSLDDGSVDPVTQDASAQAQQQTRTVPSYEKVGARLFANDPFSDHLVAFDDGQLSDGWSVAWSDLMMVMFVLFAGMLIVKMLNPDVVIRYQPEPVISEVEIEVPVETEVLVDVPIRQPSLDPIARLNVFDKSTEAIREADLENVEIVILEDQSVSVSVQGPMLFELGKADLRAEMQDFLDRLAIVIRETPFEVQVVGHTDDQPINSERFPSNWELSLVRASRVARYLIESADLDPTRFVVMGHGQYAPAARNDDPQARALNRRVEIIITRTSAGESTDVQSGAEKQVEGNRNDNL